MPIDKETKKVLSQGDHLKHLVASEGWAIVRDKFINKVMDLQSVLNVVDSANPQDVIIDIKSRGAAIKILVDLIKEIESNVEQHIENRSRMKEADHVRHYDGDESSGAGTN